MVLRLAHWKGACCEFRMPLLSGRPMSGVGQLRRTQCEQMSSGLPLKADTAQYSRHVSNVPTTEVVNIHLASDTTDSSDYIRDRAEDLACDYFKSRKRA
jgi:hypothetical protein